MVKSQAPVTGIQSVCTGRHLFLDGYPIFDSQGKVTLVVTFIRDMTAIQRLKKHFSSQQELLEAYQVLQSSGKTKNPGVLLTKGLSPARKRLRMVADTDATVLLLGETGVGKDVFARKLHKLSDRSDKPFIKADCSCIPENLMESEFFGYMPGAFSGASANGKAGFFEMADTGTLFLDEIGELTPQLQVKLLRALQDREIVRVGSTIPKTVDVRVVAATNRDLEKEVNVGRFRRDLFYRLKVAVIEIPPVRERRQDILPLVEDFLKFYTEKYKRSLALSETVKEAMYDYSWPGNVREIENLIHSLVATCEKDAAELEDLPASMSSQHKKCMRPGDLSESALKDLPDIDLEDKSLQDIMQDFEKCVVMSALNKSGSINEAAQLLKIDRSTLFRKVKKFQAAEQGEQERHQQSNAGQGKYQIDR